MTDTFTFTGLGSHQNTNNTDSLITVNTMTLTHPTIYISMLRVKKGFQTTVTGLTEEYVKEQNENLTIEDVVRTFKIKKGCQGYVKKNPETKEITIYFRGNHREEVKTYLQNILGIEEDQFKDQGI